jgi:hypothetical protein
MTKPHVSTTSDQLEVSSHMRETFAKAEELIWKTYGNSPSAETLMRMWMLSATSLSVMEEFEEAVMETGGDVSTQERKPDGNTLTL